jgi:hypothetical protein
MYGLPVVGLVVVILAHDEQVGEAVVGRIVVPVMHDAVHLSTALADPR